VATDTFGQHRESPRVTPGARYAYTARVRVRYPHSGSCQAGQRVRALHRALKGLDHGGSTVKLRPITTTLALVLVAGVLGATVGADFFWRAAIGLDPTAFPAGESLQKFGEMLFPGLDVALAGLLLGLGTVLIVPVVAFFVLRAQRRTRLEQADPGRRNFLSGSLVGGGAAIATLVAGGGAMVGRSFYGLGHKEGRGWKGPLTEIFGGKVQKTHPEWKDEWRGSRIQSYGRLGRTEWPVSDTVLGTGPIRGELGTKIVRLALDRGVNYIDTAPDYSAEGSETAVGQAIRGVPRESFFLATKWCTPIGHLPAGTSVESYKRAVEESLARLGTDYVDLVHVHSCDQVDRLLDPNVHEAFAELKSEGKVRFLGFSSHTPNLLEVANAAIDSGKFDVMMLAYHHGIWPGLSEVIERAQREQDMGIVAMKTLKGAKHHGLEGFGDEEDSYAQAALKWVHGNPNVSCAVISFFDLQHVDEYLYASGKRPDTADLAVLDKYDSLTAETYCAPHCGACLSSCPEQVAINDVLRHRMYFEDYRSERQAIDLYAGLERNASVCTGCSAPCTGSCPYGIQIQERMIGAHELLSVRPTAS
jgi:predicted aldo/keto reductase-like oxidoreductase